MHLLTLFALAIGCISILILIPAQAHRGKLHVPGYVGLALITFGASVLFGYACGYRRFVGSPIGVVLSVFCFWAAAAGVASILALFFFREQEAEV